MDETPTPSSLTSKLTDVMHAVGRIPKSGRNTFHGYDYATESDIVEAIRGELASRNILLIPEIESHERVPVGEKGEVVTLLRMLFTFKDGDSGEEISRTWMGSGSDKSDKGLYKAMTGGAKYFLMKTFLMPTGDDPEAEDHGKAAAKVCPECTGVPDGAFPKGYCERCGATKNKPKSSPAAPRRAPDKAANPPTKAGALFVQHVKEAKKGSNAKGPWTLYIVTLTDGRELKTFDEYMADAARHAESNGVELRARIDGDKLVSLT